MFYTLDQLKEEQNNQPEIGKKAKSLAKMYSCGLITPPEDSRHLYEMATKTKVRLQHTQFV